MSIAEPVRLFDEFRQRRRDLYRTVGPGALITIVAFLVAFHFVEPPPPGKIVIATGTTGGHYHTFAKQYATSLAEHGVQLELRETAGSLENFHLLLHDDEVSLAIVQGGTAPNEAHQADSIEAIASLYFEPLWVFHRSDLVINDLGDLQGRRIALGDPDSGSYSLATQLLSVNGVEDGVEGTTFVNHSAMESAAFLQADQLDVAIFVLAPDGDIVQDLLEDPNISVLDFARQHAYARRFPYLKAVVLEEGVIDFANNLPAQRVRLIAPAANLVATHALHRAFIPLLLEAALDQHHSGGLLADDGELPSQAYVSFPVNVAARNFLQHGPSFFQEHLGFWIASLIDRTKIMIIPLLTLLIPLFKLAPPIYRWRIRSRIYRWYGVLRRIDQQLSDGDGDETNIAKHAAMLHAMSTELNSVHIPLSYMEEFYNLRLHLDLVTADLAKLSDKLESADADPTSAKPGPVTVGQ